MKGDGEPCAGEPHARFDGRGLETERISVTAPAPDPTNLLPDTPHKTRERDVTELLNKVVAHGWRLVAVNGQPGQYGEKTYGYFERPAQPHA